MPVFVQEEASVEYLTPRTNPVTANSFDNIKVSRVAVLLEAGKYV